MENMMGKCEYCGAEIGVMAETQAEANKMAEEKCACAGVRSARKKEMMKEKLDSLIGQDCSAEFNPVEKAVHDAIETIGLMLVDGIIRKASFTVDGTTITLKTGKKIEVTRRRIYEQTGEIEE